MLEEVILVTLLMPRSKKKGLNYLQYLIHLHHSPPVHLEVKMQNSKSESVLT